MKKAIPEYKTVIYNGIQYYRTRIEDADGKRVALYGKTREKLYEKVQEAKRQIEEASFRRETPTVKEYCEKWLVMQSAHIRQTTLTDYTSKVKNYIKTTSELSTSAEVYNVLSQKVRELCDQAIENAKNAKRKTVMAKDF